MKLLLWCLCFVGVFWLMGFAVGTLMAEKPKKEDCITMQLITSNPAFEGQALVVGDVKVCGIELHFTGVTGPSEKPSLGNIPRTMNNTKCCTNLAGRRQVDRILEALA